MFFDARRGKATNPSIPKTATYNALLGAVEIQNNLEASVPEGGRMLRLTLHQQFEVIKDSEYMHLTIGSKIQPDPKERMLPQPFTLHYVELGTNRFQSSSPDLSNDRRDDFILHGEGRLHQMISVDRHIRRGGEKAAATKIRSYGISDKAEFAVTLHLRELLIPADSAPKGASNSTIIDIVAPAPKPITETPGTTSPSCTGVRGVISVWDLRLPSVSISEDVRSQPAWETLPYLTPCAEIDIALPSNLHTPEAWDNFRASISISSQGAKVVLSGIEKTYGVLPCAVYDCKHTNRVDKIGASRSIEITTRPTCKELKEFAGYGLFHRVDPTMLDVSDDNDNERFIAFNGSVLEVYSIKYSGWRQLQRITLSLLPDVYRANYSAIAQSLRGRYFAWTGDPGVVSIWDMEKGKSLSTIFVNEDKNPIYAVLSPDGTKIAISVKGEVQIYETFTGILLGVHTKGVMPDNNSEVVLGNEYFVVRDNSLSPQKPVRSVVRIRDREVIKPATTSLHEDYHIAYPLASMNTIAAYKQGSVLNIKRLTGIEAPRVHHPCGQAPCEPNEVLIDDFIIKKTFTYTSGAGEVFHAKCRQERHNGCWNVMLEIAVNGDSNDPLTGAKSMVLPLGDTPTPFRGFYLPKPSKLVIFADGYMTIWTLSSKTTYICQLDYIWDSLSYEPEPPGDYCHRPLNKAWACSHGTSMKFHLGKPVWYKNHEVVCGDPDSTLYDVLTVPPQQKDETVMTTETERLGYGILSLIDTYFCGDSSFKEDIVRYLLTCIRPSTVNKTSCLVLLCKAWSTKNQGYLTQLVSDILPKEEITWIPDPKADKSMDPLAALLDVAKGKSSAIKLVRVLVDYCFAQTTSSMSLTFLAPLFANMHAIMEYYGEEALDYIGRIAFIPTKQPIYIWKNHVLCQDISPFRFSPWNYIRRKWKSESDIRRKANLNPIMHLKLTVDDGGKNEDNLEKPVYMATFDAIWRISDARKRIQGVDGWDKGHGGGEKGGASGKEGAIGEGATGKEGATGNEDTTGKEGASGNEDASVKGSVSGRQWLLHRMITNFFGRVFVKDEATSQEKTNWWKVVAQFLSPQVICYDFSLEFLDNPAIDALVTFKWETIGFMYWFVRFFCQCIYYILVVTAALAQVYSPTPSKLYGVFVAIIIIGVAFVFLEILQAIPEFKRYFTSHYIFMDLLTFTLPPIASAMQLHFIHTQDTTGNNRALSFSILVIFVHMLLELRISRSVCKYVTIIQQAVSEIFVFLVIGVGCILTFTITILHVLESCPYEGCTRDETRYPINFLGGLSTTTFFLGGRFEAVSNDLDANVSKDWAFHLVMFIFLISTSILMMNVLIALINVAFTKGDDGWRLMWIQSRLRYIESAENLSYRFPSLRLNHDLFPNQIYFTATKKAKKAYYKKHPDLKKKGGSSDPRNSKRASRRDVGDNRTSQGSQIVTPSGGSDNSPQSHATTGKIESGAKSNPVDEEQEQERKQEHGEEVAEGDEQTQEREMGKEKEKGKGRGKGKGSKEEASNKNMAPTVVMELFRQLESQMQDVLRETQESHRQALELQRQESQKQMEISKQHILALVDQMKQSTSPIPASS
ncbi:hypothetical protein BGZ95_002271 [Linnemannia exigua]|uniref:Ion transport domain-containing protein n=1 Tax=Linnemannia exigua TaxID=604196 RepID=A0AAD4D5P4_9FUNG|nr:hypothetical protein BGZ95_002271 [Linnemannia exigua]